MVKKKQAIEILEGLRDNLKRLAEDEDSLPASPAFVEWQFSTETAIRTIFPDKQRHLLRFGSITFVRSYVYNSPRLGESTQGKLHRLSAPRRVFLKGMAEADAILRSMIEEVRTYWSEDGTLLNPHGAQPAPMPSSSTVTNVKRSSVVFVVHGRNIALSEAMFTFLNAIGLDPLEWSEACAATKQASPYIGDILDRAFSMAQAVVVLMTPDDEAWLKGEFRNQDDPQHETTLTGQARPNVLFEAGMAMGREPERTVLVEVGTLRPFSDVVGRHTVRLDNSTERRQELAQRLKTAGCPVNLEGTRWHRAGSFEIKTFKKPDSTHPKELSPTAASIEPENVPREAPRS
jgi:predicted nucleotide-binding protein